MWSLRLGGVFLLGLLSLPSLAKSQLAIIIDDIGYNELNSQRAARLSGDFTLAVLPFTPHGSAAAQTALKYNKELLLHLPMSNLHSFPLGRGGLTESLSEADFKRIIREDIAQIPQLKGVNNHMGSRLTQNGKAMEWLMQELLAHQLFFIDSRTTAQTKAFDTAVYYGVSRAKRDVFLDDVDSIPAITSALNKAVSLAQSNGFAIAIGHPYSNTLSLLEKVQGRLEAANVELVFASKLINRSQPLIDNKHHPVRLYTKSGPKTGPNDFCPLELPIPQNVLSGFIDLNAKNVNMVTLPEH